MNTQLNLRVQKSFEGETIAQGAIVEVRSLNEAGRTISTRREAVPMGNDTSWYSTLPVDPGLYEISALLPSGKSVVRTVEVTGKEEYVDATLDGETSQFERSPWYGLDLKRTNRPFSKREEWEARRDTIRVGGHRLKMTAGVSLLQRPLADNNVRDEVWDRVCGGISELELDWALDSRSLFTGLPSGITHFEQIASDVIQLHSDASEGELRSRTYLVVRYRGQTMLCAMPWPWRGTHGNGVPVEAIISEPSWPIGSPWSVKISVKDDMFSNVLEYFSVGEEKIARELLTPAKEFLYYKIENPLAATAGAYILLNHWINDGAKEESDFDWIEWIKNLNRLNPWLPDAAILEGWLALRIRQNAPVLEEARSLLLKAERRGIPLYSAGVRRLADGLMVIAGEASRRGRIDEEVDAALGRVRRLAWQIDPVQPFTCIRLWDY